MASSKPYQQRLFGAACLKVTLEKSRGVGTAELDLYRGALKDLELSDEEVEAFLKNNRSAVVAALERKK